MEERVARARYSQGINFRSFKETDGGLAARSRKCAVGKGAQVMLSAGNEKLNAAAKQLVDIRLQKDNLPEAAPSTGESRECRSKCCGCTDTAN